MSNFKPQDNKNCEHNVFRGIPAKPKQENFFSEFLREQDISVNTVNALILDVRKFAKWFTTVNQEPWDIERVTIRDVSDFKEHLRTEKQQAASTINRNLASIRKYFKWLSGKGCVEVNPTIGIKELKRQPLAPQGLTRAEVRKLLREVELRKDIRAKAIFSLILYSGARLSDLVTLELSDVMMNDRSGTVFFRYGKGSKQRTLPLPLNARKALSEYICTRPPLDTQKVFLGERGALNSRGVQAIFEKYKALTGIDNLHCHVLRHTFSHTFLSSAEKGGAGGNLVQLASILGHESLNTVKIYTTNTVEQLAEATDQMVY